MCAMVNTIDPGINPRNGRDLVIGLYSISVISPSDDSTMAIAAIIRGNEGEHTAIAQANKLISVVSTSLPGRPNQRNNLFIR